MKKSYNLSLFFSFFFKIQLQDESFSWHVNYSTKMYLTVYLHKLVSHPSTNLWIRIVYVNWICLLTSRLGKARDTERAASSSRQPCQVANFTSSQSPLYPLVYHIYKDNWNSFLQDTNCSLFKISLLYPSIIVC